MLNVRKEIIYYGYETIINDFLNAPCGPQIPTPSVNASYYGGSQSFVSTTFYKNVLKTVYKRTS